MITKIHAKPFLFKSFMLSRLLRKSLESIKSTPQKTLIKWLTLIESQVLNLTKASLPLKFCKELEINSLKVTAGQALHFTMVE